jgi:UDP-N-acetylmuramoyl-L-alanyl-D-glutamate--2,6-diaminopimelate ligase
LKNLKDILYKVNLIEVSGSTDRVVEGVTMDSRKAEKGFVFVAVKGTQNDGHEFISQAIKKGSPVIICEVFPDKLTDGTTYIKVQDAPLALATLADNFYDNPSSKLKIIAVTGTNGKTTIATLLFRLFRQLGERCGLISTIQNQIEDELIPATHTTPDAVQLTALLKMMVDGGCSYCFMEASSHAIEQKRVAAINFTGAIFTNITHDHLDYHKTFDNYIAAKKKLFDNLSKDAFALVNIDDKHGAVMLQNCKAKKYTYSLNSASDFRAKILENSFAGLLLSIDGADVNTHLIGDFNAYNLLAVYGAANLLGKNKIEVLTAISLLGPAEGRFDYVISPHAKITAIVDYAHTPDALEKVLETIKHLRTGNEQLITVVGCGGDRDKTKRPIMADIACRASDKVILTSDNPRSEDPLDIIGDMKQGVKAHNVKKVLIIPDRREAIKVACALAENKDIILIAGKGHEKYQEIKGVKYPFDDKEIVWETLETLDK